MRRQRAYGSRLYAANESGYYYYDDDDDGPEDRGYGGYARRPPVQQQPSYGYRGRTRQPVALVGDGDEPEERPESELGREMLGLLGFETEGGPEVREDDFFAAPDDEWERQSGHEKRRGLSDWVKKHDPRARDEDVYDPDEGHLIDLGEEDDEDGSGAFNPGRMSQNLDGPFDMDDINQDEMRRAMELQAQSRLGGAIREPALPPKAVRKLVRRFRAAQARAIDGEARAAKGLMGANRSLLTPSVSAKRWASDRARIARVFDPHTRVNDMERALGFFATHSDDLQLLKRTAQEAGLAARAQFGDYAGDIVRRVGQQLQRQNKAKSSTKGRKIKRKPTAELGAAVASRRQVGRSMRRMPPAPAAGRSKGGYSALDVPVFSRASWTIGHASGGSSGEDDEEDEEAALSGAAVAKSPDYHLLGNARFLAARLGLKSASSQRSAERDAIRFFKRRFGLDFTPESGAKRNASTGVIAHASLPAAMKPYTVSGELDSRVTVAEGHLASANDPCPDPVGNGVRLYAKDGDAGRTSVAEAGWLVHPTTREGLKIQRDNGTQLLLPRGSILATGFWILHRPAAPPALLRFQSSGPPQVIGQKLKDKASKDHGVSHETTSRWDVYDMAHDAGTRPGKGVGRAVSVVRIDHWHDRANEHKSRTMLTVHH